MGQANYTNGFEVTLHSEMLEVPLRWKRPRRIFVNSMSDLFHEAVPDNYISQVFVTMHQAHWHQFQVLTKRSERILNHVFWPRNVWMGVSIESNDYLARINDLRI